MPQVLHAGRQLFRSIWKKTSRRLLRAALFFSPEERKTRAERWLRGREQVKKLQQSDIVIVSFGKSGRTWLRVMLSRLYQVKHGLSQRYLMGFDNFHHMNRAIPKVFYTHDNYIKDYTGNVDSKADFYDHKVVLLARDPRDVAVSQFFQWQYRMKPNKKILNRYPGEDADISIFDFVMDKDAGLPKVIDFLNLWASERSRLKGFFLLRYEDLRAQPEATLAKLLEFMGTPGTPEEIREAVEFSSYENMKKMEEKKTFWLSGGRMVPKDRDNPNTYKVRRAKVGGYRDYFDDEQVAQIEALVNDTLSPFFGYNSTA
ncbi:MAG: sulfotransferase domain-containing protein [Gammaproteobacteria bacterium]|nr:MAG: sulfotransferase domain-containing protein [Gammaproteobacteria bacterium]